MRDKKLQLTPNGIALLHYLMAHPYELLPYIQDEPIPYLAGVMQRFVAAKGSCLPGSCLPAGLKERCNYENN